jgi:parallel beta-helix repeat protein
MRDRIARRTAGLALAAATLVTALLASARPAEAGTCGGTVPCKCGDTVASSTVLDRDLGVCTGIGLKVLSGVELDCAGHLLTGSNLSNAKYGINLDGAVGATVRNCRMTLFRRGIRVNGGSGNRILGNESFLNKYGVDIAGASSANRFEGNLVRDNRDEGMHFGTGSSWNEVVGNEIRYNKRENLYLLSSHHNLVEGNVVHHGNMAAIYVKHSSDNHFVGNEVRDTSLQLRGDSARNVFEGNFLKGDGYMLQAHLKSGAWTFPHDNAMSGDTIVKTDFCHRFFGAHDNHATGLVTDGRCAPITIRTVGGETSTSNTVEVAP